MSKQMEKGTENSGFLDGRDYTAAFLYEAIALLVGNGVYANELAPTATNEDMSITHGAGRAWIGGVLYKNETPFDVQFDTADGSLNRYDSLMVRRNLSINETYAIVIKGSYATSPTPPEVTRNAEIYDLKICDVYIPAGCTKITQDQITDTRLDSSVCGVPVFPVEHMDMTTFYRQIATDLANFKSQEQADFSTWVKDQKESNLDTLAALVEVVRQTSNDSKDEISNLLEQLKDLVDDSTVGSLVNQINEKISKTGDEMTGNLSIPAPMEAAHAANKEYVDAMKLLFTDVSVAVSAFVEDGTYEDYGYRAAIPLTGVTASRIPDVIFALEDAISGNFAPVAKSYDGGIYIYASSPPDSAVTIPTIICWKGE